MLITINMEKVFVYKFALLFLFSSLQTVSGTEVSQSFKGFKSGSFQSDGSFQGSSSSSPLPGFHQSDLDFWFNYPHNYLVIGRDGKILQSLNGESTKKGGKRVLSHCRSSQSPELEVVDQKTSISWFQYFPLGDRIPIKSNGNSTSTTLVSVDPSSGSLVIDKPPRPIRDFDGQKLVFRCVASNQLGSIISPPIQFSIVSLGSLNEDRVLAQDVQASRGGSALLRCSVLNSKGKMSEGDLSNLYKVQGWVEDENFLITSNQKYFSPAPDGENPRGNGVSVRGGGSRLAGEDLFLFSVDSADVYKSFRCLIANRLNGDLLKSNPARILLTPSEKEEPVSLNNEEIHLKGKIGGEIHLPCAGSGKTPPQYKWFKRDDSTGILRELSPAGNEPFILPRLRLADSGLYFCHVNNSHSEEIVRVRLEVEGLTSVHMSPNIQTVDIGRATSFRCLVSPSKETGRFLWFKNGLQIDGNSKKYKISGELLIINSVEVESLGIYQCFTEHGQLFDSGELRLGASRPTLLYKFSEQTVRPGVALLSLKCIGQGNPPPTFVWLLDGIPILQLDHSITERFIIGQYVTVEDKVISHLNITNLRVQDGGLFTCEASNSVSSVIHSARLNIYGPLVMRPIPPVALRAVSGRPYQLQCPVAGYPIESIRWEKDGLELPGNRRQKIFPGNGTLLVEFIEKGDEGAFRCIANSRQEPTISSPEFQLKVIVSPKISPFGFPSQLLREGMRVSVTCQILEGDIPVSFQWEFRGEPIESLHIKGVSIRNSDAFSSLLTIENLSIEHNGKFSCQVQNVAGMDHFSAQLTVNVPPKWKVQPKDLNITLGSGLLRIDCLAEGHPEVRYSWKKLSNSGGTARRLVNGSHDGVYILANGSLVLREISTTLIGGLNEQNQKFECEAKNGIGDPLVKIISIRVHSPAKIRDKNGTVVKIKVGDQARINCTSGGDPPITVQWLRSDLMPLLNGNHNKRLVVVEEKGDSLMKSSVLQVGPPTMRGDSSWYICRASNSYGSDSAHFQLKILEAPEPPKNLRAIKLLSRELELGWTKSDFDGNSAITSYIVQYKFLSDTWDLDEVSEVQFPGGVNTGIMKGLRPFTSYQLRLLSRNEVSTSAPSDPIQITTVEDFPEAFPREIQILPLSSTKLNVKFQPPHDRALWNGLILGYYIGYKEMHSTQDNKLSAEMSMEDNELYSNHKVKNDQYNGFQFRNVAVGPDFGGEILLDNLKKYTKYRIVIQCFNSKGNGPFSQPQIGQTLQDVPSLPPINVKCLSASKRSLTVQWDDPPKSGRNGIIEGFKVAYSESEVSWDSLYDDFSEENPSRSELTGSISSDLSAPELELEEKVKLTALREVRLEDLKPWTNYTFRVLAFTSIGDGIWSDTPIICSTSEDLPNPIEKVKAFAGSKNSIKVSWLAPFRPNGIIEKYTIYTSTEHDREGKKETLLVSTMKSQLGNYHFEIRGIREGAVEVWITASNRLGESTPSKKIRVQTLTTNKVPGKILSFGRILKVPWKRDLRLDCSVIGVPEPKIQWKLFRNDQTPMIDINSQQNAGLKNFNLSSNGAQLTIGEILPNLEANYTCQISSPLGGPDSITYTVIVLVPPPAPVINSKQTTLDSVTLSWTFQNYDRIKLPIQGYIINYKKMENRELVDESESGIGVWEEIEIGKRSLINEFRIDGLNCGSKYSVYISAKNRIGTGIPSDILFVQTKGKAFLSEKPQKGELIGLTNGTWLRLNFEKWGKALEEQESSNFHQQGRNQKLKSSEKLCPIRKYSIEIKYIMEKFQQQINSNSDTTWPIRFELPGDSKQHSLRLEEDRQYELKVRAFTDPGYFDASYELNTGTTGQDHYKGFEDDWESTAEDRSSESSPSSLFLFIIVPVTIASLAITGALLLAALFHRRKTPQTVLRSRSFQVGYQGPPSDPTQMLRFESTSTTLKKSSDFGSEQMELSESPNHPASKSPRYSQMIHQRRKDTYEYKDDVSPYATFELLPDEIPARPNFYQPTPPTRLPPIQAEIPSYQTSYNSTNNTGYFAQPNDCSTINRQQLVDERTMYNVVYGGTYRSLHAAPSFTYIQPNDFEDLSEAPTLLLKDKERDRSRHGKPRSRAKRRNSQSMSTSSGTGSNRMSSSSSGAEDLDNSPSLHCFEKQQDQSSMVSRTRRSVGSTLPPSRGIPIIGEPMIVEPPLHFSDQQLRDQQDFLLYGTNGRRKRNSRGNRTHNRHIDV